MRFFAPVFFECDRFFPLSCREENANRVYRDIVYIYISLYGERGNAFALCFRSGPNRDWKIISRELKRRADQTWRVHAGFLRFGGGKFPTFSTYAWTMGFIIFWFAAVVWLGFVVMHAYSTFSK